MHVIRSTAALGALIREQRKKQKVTQIQLAAISGVGVRFIRELEYGKTTCQIEKAIMVIETLGLQLILASRGERLP